MNIILKKAVISEKSMKMAKEGWYTFLVEKSARKPVIAKAVEDQFGVDVVAIKTANFKEENKTQRSRKGRFTLPGFKKAVVALKKGQKIGLFTAEEPVKVETAEGLGEVKEKKSLLRKNKVKIEKSSSAKATEDKGGK